jgi:hypothetical protein
VKLRGYFALVESGAALIPRAAVLARMTTAEHDALRGAGLVRLGRDRSEWPCDQALRCAREVLPAAPGGAAPFVGVCEKTGHDDDRCPAVDLTAEDLAQESLPLDELARQLQRLYALRGERLTARALAARPEPILLGAQNERTPARDVYLALAAGEASFPHFLTVRERVKRATLVLVPTARRVSTEMAGRYAPGGAVEIEVLEDALSIADGALAFAPRLRLVPPPVEGGIDTRPIAAIIGATAWKEIRIAVVDGHTIRIQCGQRTVRRTYLDLGLASKTSREPTRKWKLLLAVCAGRGTFRWKTLGSFDAAKNTVFLLRKTLKKTFGLDDDPFHEFTFADGWRAKFVALPEIEDNL